MSLQSNRSILQATFLSLLTSATRATSTTSHRPSVRQQLDRTTAGAIAAEWVRFIIVVAAAALNTKAPMLWSESRILRKVKARRPCYLRLSAEPKDRDHAFVQLYVSLSKGRHRTYSRLYPLLYYLFSFSITVIDAIEVLSNGSFEPDVTASEALTALRLLIYFGSFATFGAVKLPPIQKAFLLSYTMALSTLHITVGYGVVTLSATTRRIFGITQLILIMLLIVIYVLYETIRYRANTVSLADIASVMNIKRENNFGDPNLEDVDLRENLTKDQKDRLNVMEKASKQKYFDEMIARKVLPWDWQYITELCLFFIVSGMSALSWGVVSEVEIPRIVFMEALEALSVFLLYVNETTVENLLFVRLLQIANIPKDEAKRIVDRDDVL